MKRSMQRTSPEHRHPIQASTDVQAVAVRLQQPQGIHYRLKTITNIRMRREISAGN